LTTVQVQGKAESRARAGTHALTLLAAPANVFVLRALAEGPCSLVDLRREIGSPPQTTMRRQLRTLTDIGVLARGRQADFPGSLDFELTDPGRELLEVAEILGVWLANAPEGPLPLGSVAAKSAVGALVEGWETNMLRALAAKPFSLTELDNLISALSYPSLERRLTAMRIAGQIEPLPSRGRGTPYVVTEWLRRAVAPLSIAARWELLHLNGRSAPLGSRDTEASLLLAVPLLRLETGLSGSCRLAVDSGRGERHRLSGVMVGVEHGRVTTCSTRLEGHPEAWAVGSFAAWFAAVIDLDTSRLEMGGDRSLAAGLLEGLHGALFGRGTPPPNPALGNC
jgi:DNA-binding HxlR family transcriptional regulator